ncbi:MULTISPECIES: hypothetical protein [Rhodococcus]|uniref:Uncharacterized protein n=1 Tax=Rhodococcus qingshengii JCM 15477 TaxID=1303681 RepID=A0AB38RMG0_RHOSG|nr:MULTISPECIES: hypothetical protein [Rhodococcus]MYV31250.1 hypothetical protein [Rhodococcus erythropolis]UPU46362.1 hypothetical protein M0639_30830 [Rhodococcus qingshengii JCM 15477]
MNVETVEPCLLKKWSFWITTLLALVVLVVIWRFGLAAYRKWGHEAFLAGLGKFAVSPGFGGLMAVAAAGIAFIGVSAAGRNARRIARAERYQDFVTTQQEKWWEQALWALNLATGTAKDNRPLGYDSLTILLKVEEKYRPVGAAELVRNVTAGPLALPSGILEDLLKQASEVDVDSNSGENLGEGKVE